MRIRSIALVAALLALVVPDALARVKVTINFDKAFDFKSVKTWGWGPDGPGSIMMARTADDDPDAMKKIAEPPIVDAVTVEMTRRGLVQAPSGPDVIVTYYLLLTTSMSTQTVGQFIDADHGVGPAAVSAGDPITEDPESRIAGARPERQGHGGVARRGAGGAQDGHPDQEKGRAHS